MARTRRSLTIDAMRSWFREGFYGGLAIALLTGLFLFWLWRSEHQVKRHSENLLYAAEKKNWIRFAEFIGNDYEDQWGNDRALVLERTRELFGYLRSVELNADLALVWIDDKGIGHWQAKIRIDGTDSEAMTLLKERINSLNTPFQLQWRRMSAKPWDWKLVRVSNAELEIPREFQ